jgi:hypothetical protein
MPILRFVVVLWLCALALPAGAQRSELAWTILANERGARVEYPRELFSAENTGTKSKRSFTTADGRGHFELFSMPNVQGDTPARFVRRVDQKREKLTYKRISRNFIAASTVHGDRILYRRCNFSGNMIHCVDLRYPAADKRAWDDIVTRISLSLRPR